MAELGVREVTLIGGEAYLRDDWDIAAEIGGRGMVCSIVGGARHMPNARTSAGEAGVGKRTLSLDGMELTHDGCAPVGYW